MLQRMGIEHSSNCKHCRIRAAICSGGIQDSITEVQTHLHRSREGFGVSLDSSTAKTTKFSCLVIGNKGSEEFLMLAGLGLHFQERKRTLP